MFFAKAAPLSPVPLRDRRRASVPADCEMMPAGNQRDALANLEQDVPDPRQRHAFLVPLLGIRCNRQKPKLARDLDDVLRQIGFGRRWRTRKIQRLGNALAGRRR
jgi:hypothetical protein